MLLDVVFPPCCLACGVLLRGRPDPELCSACAAAIAPLPDPLRHTDGITARYPYDGPFAQAVARCKYAADAALAGPLGRALAGDPLWVADEHGAPWDLIACVPMHRWRRLRRGFDHARLMLGHAWRRRPVGRACAGLLVRVRNDPPQATLAAAARRTNLVGAFALARGAPSVVGARVLVVDDVTTTGATLAQTIAVLRRAGAAEVRALALLRTLPT